AHPAGLPGDVARVPASLPPGDLRDAGAALSRVLLSAEQDRGDLLGDAEEPDGPAPAPARGRGVPALPAHAPEPPGGCRPETSSRVERECVARGGCAKAVPRPATPARQTGHAKRDTLEEAVAVRAVALALLVRVEPELCQCVAVRAVFLLRGLREEPLHARL